MASTKNRQGEPARWMPTVVVAIFVFAPFFGLGYGQTIHPVYGVLLVLGIATAWCLATGGAFEFKLHGRRARLGIVDWCCVLAVLGVALGAHWQFLHLPFTWMGDEEFHVRRWMLVRDELGAAFGSPWLWILGGASLATVGAHRLGGFCGFRWGRWVPVIVVGAFIVQIGIQMDISGLDYWLLRYPPIVVIAETVTANSLWGSGYSEFAHRLVAFVPMTLAGLFPFFVLRGLGKRRGISFLGSVLVLTMPMIVHHSRLLYIEPLLLLWQSAVLTMLWFWPKHPSAGQLSALGACISVGGLIKETAIPFIGICWLVVVVGIYINNRDRQSLREMGWKAVRFGGLCFLPATFYMGLRISGGSRPYGAHFENLLSSQVYINFGEVIGRFFTVGMVVLASVGLIMVLYRKREFQPAPIVAVLTAVGYFAFFVIDSKDFIGLCRFNLHLWPFFAVGIVAFLAEGTRTPLKTRVVVLLGCGVVAGSLYARPPLDQSDGEWGALYTAVDVYTPFDTVLNLVEIADAPEIPIAVCEVSYPYHHALFLFEKHGITTTDVTFKAESFHECVRRMRGRGLDDFWVIRHGADIRATQPLGARFEGEEVLGQQRIALYRVGASGVTSGWARLREAESKTSELLVARDYEAALVSCREVLVLDPNSGSALVELATLQLGRGELGSAQATVLKAVKHDPGNERARAMIEEAFGGAHAAE